MILYIQYVHASSNEHQRIFWFKNGGPDWRSVVKLIWASTSHTCNARCTTLYEGKLVAPSELPPSLLGTSHGNKRLLPIDASVLVFGAGAVHGS